MLDLLQMIQYCRPSGSDTERQFCEDYLEPVFGKPDVDGNYILHIGESPICFMAHYDTVHSTDGFQSVTLTENVLSLAEGESTGCLGADCTTGVWLILQMIKAGIAGTYIIHSAEEIGCIGSGALVKRNPDWIADKRFAISFDRKGVTEIITHQMGVRTASDAFAESLASTLGIPLGASPNGSYTDSNEYRGVISECTNLAVGYYDQHTQREVQDLAYLRTLRDALVRADWSALVSEREPNDCEREGWGYLFDTDQQETLEDFVSDNPSLVADLLESYGMTLDTIKEELSIAY